jgi:hypothetical protein
MPTKTNPILDPLARELADPEVLDRKNIMDRILALEAIVLALLAERRS